MEGNNYQNNDDLDRSDEVDLMRDVDNPEEFQQEMANES